VLHNSNYSTIRNAAPYLQQPIKSSEIKGIIAEYILTW